MVAGEEVGDGVEADGSVHRRSMQLAEAHAVSLTPAVMWLPSTETREGCAGPAGRFDYQIITNKPSERISVFLHID